MTSIDPARGRLTNAGEEGRGGRSAAGTKTKIERAVRRGCSGQLRLPPDNHHHSYRDGDAREKEMTPVEGGQQTLVTQLMRVRVQRVMKFRRTGQREQPEPEQQHQPGGGDSPGAVQS